MKEIRKKEYTVAPGWKGAVRVKMRALFALLSLMTLSSCNAASPSRNVASASSFRVMCYNVENLFDIQDDPLTNDEDFTPSGSYHWTRKRLSEKQQHLYQVIAHVGEWSAPAVVGLVEVENRKVLADWLQNTPLSKEDYQIVHYDSPDQRGIDVALLYRKDQMQVLTSAAIPVRFENAPRRTTRDILYVKGLVEKDTLHFFVNHWPSRSGGEKESEPNRIQAARTLRHAVDSLFRIHPLAQIIIMGDFNDTPDCVSLSEYLQAQRTVKGNKKNTLFNLTSCLAEKEKGSYKYQGEWSFLDQMIVSGGLLQAQGVYVTTESMHLFMPDYVMEEDKTYLGKKPFRMYLGPIYHGGYSDHLPVYLDLLSK